MKKIWVVVLMTLFVVTFAWPVVAEHPEDSRSAEAVTGASVMKGSGLVMNDPEYVAVSGHVNFINFISLDKKECGAFLENKKGKVICLLANEKLEGLKVEMNNMSGQVKIIGHMTRVKSEDYLLLEEYQLDDSINAKAEEHKGSGSIKEPEVE
ncbi:MAG: hypothetical protein K8S27_04225 [Candidatus Omnitrophica bacterium]|nr:hypothetical protein [Candidatus Omnitrophota bacterium]